MYLFIFYSLKSNMKYCRNFIISRFNVPEIPLRDFLRDFYIKYTAKCFGVVSCESNSGYNMIINNKAYMNLIFFFIYFLFIPLLTAACKQKKYWLKTDCLLHFCTLILRIVGNSQRNKCLDKMELVSMHKVHLPVKLPSVACE